MSSPPEPSREVVLVGAAGTTTGFGVVMALRRNWAQGVKVVAMDTNPRHLVAASAIADAFETVPQARAAAFDTELRAIIRRHGVGTYAPIHDTEIARAAALHEAAPLCAIVMAPSSASAEICLDKLRTYEWLRKAGIATPRTAPAQSAFDAPEYFLKQRYGVGSVGACRIPAAQLGKGKLPDWIVQEVCDGPEITVDALHDRSSGLFRALCRERIETKAGVCTKARLFRDPALETATRDIARGLALHGALCVQFMKLAQDWAVTDVNPRPGAGTAMSAAAGMDFAAAAFALAWKRDPAPYLAGADRVVHVTRQYTEFVMSQQP